MIKRMRPFVAALLVIAIFSSFNHTDALSYDSDGFINNIDGSEVIKNFVKETALLDYVDIDSFKKHRHLKRLKNEEDLNSYVFLNDDGTKSVYVFGDDLKYIDENGVIKEKDITLVKNPLGYSIKDNCFDVLFPNYISDGVSITCNNGFLEFKTSEMEAHSCAENKTTKSIGYSFDSGAELILQPTLSGVSGMLVLDDLRILEKVRFDLGFSDMRIKRSADGLELFDKSGEVIFKIQNPVIYSESNEGVCPIVCEYSVETSDGIKYTTSIKTPNEVQSYNEVSSPFLLTMSVIIYPQRIEGSASIQDTIVFSGYPTSNFSSYIYLTVGYCDNAHKKGRVLVNLPGLYNHMLFKDATVDADIVEVKYYCWDTSGNNTQYINLFGNKTGSWHHSSVTWNTAPQYYTTSNYGSNMSNATWTSFDITALARSWRFDGSSSRGFTLVNQNETNQSFKKAPYSIESTTRPPYVVLTVHGQMIPPHGSGQNKDQWCWAACSKMVGQHNGATGSLDVGARVPTNFDELHTFDSENYYGQNADLTSTVDAGQRQIVLNIRGSDRSLPGSAQNIRDGLQLASAQIMTTGIVSMSETNAVNSLINELNAGRWVVMCRSGHVVVFKSYNPSTQLFTFWDPWNENVLTHRRSDFLSGSSEFFQYIYCRYGQ